MNSVDLLILIVLAVGVVRGFYTGFAKQVASVVGAVLAFLIGLQVMHPVGQMVVDSLGVSPSVAPLVGFALSFIVILLLVTGLTKLIESMLGALKLSVLNRALGGAVGAFKAALVLSVVFLVLGFIGVPSPEAQETSQFYTPVAQLVSGTWNWMAERLPEVRALAEQFQAGG